ncbi:hypothetical protein EV361DRAFT_790057 [Lentinula raphanica]|uniref:Bromodomain associated domain-containing protein n=1 Tax=Lentinula raphanica TaxID=153919 RepID=A0AA38P8U8_9AGAR|nr:hypothetical protein F5878DRAFT_537800 [Lentinula raphanica]KAJ3976511.1 hypothetical protein EV361DRAFT_790057 [Lentinula raphanica]
MDGGAQKLLESVTIRTLHAQNFSRSSTQATLVLTDLLARYLSLLTSTCAKYAEHAGRTRLTARDAVAALEELGVSVEELHEFGSVEGVELNRYALFKSLRRIEDLKEFQAQLSDGLRADHDDVIPLHYGYITPELAQLLEEEEQTRGSEDEGDDPERDDSHMDMDVDSIPSPTKRDFSFSDFLSPGPKRQRNTEWTAPEHVPSFLPPFPSTLDDPSSSQSPQIPPEPLPYPADGTGIDKPPSPSPAIAPPHPQQQQPQDIASTSAAASDYLVQVPYSQSSISAVSEWHLPSAPPSSSTSISRPEQRWATPAVEPSLLAAYHHILTHPPPPNATHMANPQRHKVAMALLALTQNASRWELPDTLFATLSTNQPRVASIGPTYPVLIGDQPPPVDGHKKGEKEFKLPATAPRSVATSERISQLVSQQGSRIPELARHVLPPTILSRTNRLTHPPPLSRNNKALTYGVGVPAPWNTNTIPPDNAAPNNAKDSQTNGKNGPPPVLPDARLFATWDHEHKDFRAPLTSAKPRARLGLANSSDLERKPSAGTISLGPRVRASSRVG